MDTPTGCHYITEITLKTRLTFPKRQILDFSKLKEFADENFKLDENDRKFFKELENTVGKGEINQGLFGKALNTIQPINQPAWVVRLESQGMHVNEYVYCQL